MRGVLAVIALAAVVVIACSESYGDANPTGADGGTSPGEDAGASDIEVTPAELDFGSITCGTDSPTARIIVLRNRGKQRADYKLVVPDGAPFEIQGPLTGTLEADAVTAVNVVARPNLPGENTSSVVVSAGSVLVQIPLKAVGDGGRLELAPTIADIGDVRYQNGGSIDVSLVNTGTREISLVSIDSSSNDFSATWKDKPAKLVLAPSTPQKVTVTLTGANVESAALAAQLTPHIDGAYCGTPPLLPVKGRRVSIEITVSPADFGNQNCNTSPSLTRTIVISNYTSSTLTYTSSLANGAGSAFVVNSGANDTIAPGTSSTPTTKSITLAMKPVGQTLGKITENVDVNISGVAAPSGGLRTTTAAADVRGAILAVTPAQLEGFVAGQLKPFAIKNTGNEKSNISYNYVRDQNTVQQTAWVTYPPPSVDPGATVNGSVRFQPQTVHGNYAGTLTFVSSNATICNAPATLHIQGNY